MSNAVFPVLPGLAMGVIRRPTFKTIQHRSVSGNEARVSNMAYPIWEIQIGFEFLRSGAQAELQKLVGFFLTCKGAWDSFLFSDPEDNAVTDQLLGTGNGVKADFQMLRGYGSGGFVFTEPVHNPNVVTAVKVDGVTKTPGTDYSVSSTGLITFTTPPTAGQQITASFSFYYRCRFKEDEAEFNKFLANLWELKRLELVGSTMNKV